MEKMNTAEEILQGVKDVYNVRRVYGEPYEKNGVTVIPAAAVRGGGGGGGGVGHMPEGEGGHEVGEGEGSGVGFGVSARPVGAWIITADDVRWSPALDLNRILVGGYIVAIAGFLFAWLMGLGRARG
jgi:uncharacterized spore protein YtfJ